jgi:hypothetical protein
MSFLTDTTPAPWSIEWEQFGAGAMLRSGQKPIADFFVEGIGDADNLSFLQQAPEYGAIWDQLEHQLGRLMVLQEEASDLWTEIALELFAKDVGEG